MGAWYDRITARARGVSAAWRKLPRKHCSGNTHSAAFTDLPTAEAACAKMGGACGGVYDNGCRFGSSNASRSVQIYLCKGGAALSTSNSSCVYTANTPPAGAHQDQLRVLRAPGPRTRFSSKWKSSWIFLEMPACMEVPSLFCQFPWNIYFATVGSQECEIPLCQSANLESRVCSCSII